MREPKRFRKKPVIVEAMRYDGNNGFYIESWSRDHVVESPILEPTPDNPSGRCVQVSTLEGVMTGGVGCWIIRGVHGEYYPCQADIFEKTYEPVPEDE